MMKRLIFVVLFIVISGCAVITPPPDDYFFNEIIVLNNSKEAVKNVSVRVDKTKMVFRCGYIAPKGECSNRFPKRKYMGNPIMLKWTFQNKEYSSDQFILRIPDDFKRDKLIKGVLEINEIGSIRPYLKQIN